MDESNVNEQIIDLMDVSLGLDYYPLFEVGTMLLLLSALFLIFKYSQRPGRIMMFFSYLISVLAYVPILVLFYLPIGHNFFGIDPWFLQYLPIASTLFSLMACIGFLIFAISFIKQPEKI